MNVEDVAKLEPLQRFLYWIRERHAIYKRRKAGKPKPWTDDEILQRFFFTNPFRENDKVTVWFRENVRDPLRNDPSVLMATIIFRWFNKIETGEVLLKHNLLVNWSRKNTMRVLGRLREDGVKIFTGAFMIPAPPGTKKLEHVCDSIQNIWKDRKRLVAFCEDSHTLQASHEQLISYRYLGGFMGYEVICDLRYTYLLENATDKLTWCNPGPGTARGLLRMLGEDLVGMPASRGCSPPDGWEDMTRNLLKECHRKLKGMPRFEMREVEHSLCEWDKYERARLNTGKLKRRYPGA